MKLSDEQITEAFKGTNFGSVDHRKLLEQGVLKLVAGYRSGYTLTRIMVDLGLITPVRRSPTKAGKMFLFNAFHDQKNSG